MPLSWESGSRSVILGSVLDFSPTLSLNAIPIVKAGSVSSCGPQYFPAQPAFSLSPFLFFIYASPFPRPSWGLWAEPLQTPWSCHSTLSCSSHISSDFPHSRNPFLPFAYPYRLTVSGTQEIWNKQLCLTSSLGSWLRARGGFSHTVKAHGLRRDVRVTGKLWKEVERILTRAETTPQTWRFKGKFWSQVMMVHSCMMCSKSSMATSWVLKPVWTTWGSASK